VPEGIKRSPGKSKFSIPRKEAPLIDGSYLDRLFADYDKQTQELQEQSGSTDIPTVEAPKPPAVVNQPSPKVDEADATLSPATPVAEISEPMTPAGPDPFPQNKPVANPPAKAMAESRPGVTSAIKTPLTAPSLPRQQPMTVPAATPSGDTGILDKWKKKHRLGKGEVKVLRVMLGMCREAGGDACYIKIPQLMQLAELRERQTQLVIRGLRELGLIEKVAEYSNLDRLGTMYRVVLDAD
jgi:hypothetical protein